MKKICYVDEDGRFGGPQQRMILVASELLKHGYKIDFVIPNQEVDIFKKKLQNFNLNYYQFNINRLSLRPKFLIRYIIFFFYEIFFLIKFFKKKKYDLIQANSTPQFKAIIASIILKMDSVWVIEDSYFPKIVVRIFKILAKISKCKIIYTSGRVNDFYFKNNFNKKNIKKEIFAPVDQNQFNIINRFNIPDYINKQKITVTTVASLVPVKGIEYFIEAADELYSKNKNLDFIIAGPEISSQIKYSRMIKKKLEGKKYIKYIGMIDNVAELLFSSQIFVCSSISEAGPITVYEAMCMKLPIVTTDVGACNQIIKQNINGIIIKIKSTNEMVSAINKIAEDNEFRKTLALNAYNFSKDFFSVKKIVREYIKVYSL